MTKYDALIVDPDIDRRMRLKTATTSVVQFKKVQLANKIAEAEDRLNAPGTWDVIFLNYSLEQEEIGKFIKKAKETDSAQDAAFILVLPAKDQESSTVASNVMIGADGFLFEPYSVDQLVEITDLAAHVKAERSAEREKAALGFLLNDIMSQIDMIAYLKSVGYDVGRGVKRFRQMCHVFDTLEGDSLTNYFDLAVEKFENAPFPEKIYQKNYKGASKRVKERMEKKLLAKLEEGLVDEEGAGEEGAKEEKATS
jgi:response regulator RpfG family c-di-GMP phosphodiesterase